MLSTIATALLALGGIYLFKIYIQFRRNVKAAQDSGIPYIIVPFFMVNRVYQVFWIVLIPLMNKLPDSWTFPWLELTLEPWGWERRHEPFKRLGSDTFITVSPERNVMFTADADVVSQITTRRNDFPKALEVYETIKMFGNNVVTSEGQTWRQHRKITSPPFSEKNNHLVWSETLDQGQTMIDRWVEHGKETAKSIHTIADDAMRLSLHVISRAGFGVRLQWPGNESSQDGIIPGAKGVTSSDIPEGHSMSYTEAMSILLHNILVILLTPHFLLSKCPGPLHVSQLF